MLLKFETKRQHATALLLAASNGDKQAIKNLLIGIDEDVLNALYPIAVSVNGTALMMAIMQGHCDIAVMLLEAGASIDTVPKSMPILGYCMVTRPASASWSIWFDVLSRILKAGASLNEICKNSELRLCGPALSLVQFGPQTEWAPTIELFLCPLGHVHGSRNEMKFRS